MMGRQSTADQPRPHASPGSQLRARTAGRPKPASPGWVPLASAALQMFSPPAPPPPSPLSPAPDPPQPPPLPGGVSRRIRVPFLHLCTEVTDQGYSGRRVAAVGWKLPAREKENQTSVITCVKTQGSVMLIVARSNSFQHITISAGGTACEAALFQEEGDVFRPRCPHLS